MSYKPQHMGAIVQRTHLSAQMWLVQLDVPIAAYAPGDSIAIWPKNPPSIVQALIEYLQLSPAHILTMPSGTTTIQQWLENDVELLLSHSVRQALLKNGVAETALVETTDLLSCLQQHLTPKQALPLLLESCSPMRPRFYSIASGASSGRIEIMVSYVQNPLSQAEGTGSSYLIKYAPSNTYCIPCRLQPARHPIPHTDLIMIATGSGMAPFRAYMQDASSSMKRWLFFGEKHPSEWYFKSFWEEKVAQGHIRITPAFSRAQTTKVYVQHKLWEHKDEVWQWLKSGATIYMCGNAKTMANEVEKCLLEIVKTHAPTEEPIAWLNNLRTTGKYIKEVY